jgi:drug/metabolite transporter (DMT)-like permease
VVAVCWADATSASTSAPVWAYLVPLAGMLSFVASTLVERGSGVRTPPLSALAIHCCTSAVAFTVLAVATGGVTPPSSASFWIATAWLVVLPTFGGYGLYWVLVERIGVTRVSSLLFLMAPVTSVWGALVFGEPLTPVTAAGLVLAFVAAVVVGRPREEGR